MMPSIPPHIAVDELPQFICRGCGGVDPVDIEMLEDMPCTHCGAGVTVDDRLEHARNVMSALVRLGRQTVLAQTLGAPADPQVPGPVSLAESRLQPER